MTHGLVVRAIDRPRPQAALPPMFSYSLPAAFFLHLLVASVVLADEIGLFSAPQQDQTVEVELVRQNTETGGGDRYVDGEGRDAGQSGAAAVNPAQAANPAAQPVVSPPSATDTAGSAPVTPSMQAAAKPSATASAVSRSNDGHIAGGAGTGRVTANRSVIPARVDSAIHNPSPAYPVEALQRGEQGRVGLRIHVLPNGLAEGADIMESSGSARLDETARHSILQWRFRPAIRDGQPVASDFLFRFDFVLSQRNNP